MDKQADKTGLKGKAQQAKAIAEENVLLTILVVGALLVWGGWIAPNLIWEIVLANTQLSVQVVFFCGVIFFAPFILLGLGWWIQGNKKLKQKQQQNKPE